LIESRIGPLDVDTAVRGYLRCSRSLRTDDEDAWDPEDPDTAAYEAVEKRSVRRRP
jgi:hypothetical protein